jgi:hypothetical protein
MLYKTMVAHLIYTVCIIQSCVYSTFIACWLKHYFIHVFMFQLHGAIIKYIWCVGFEVLTAVVMKSAIFWDITLCSPLSVNRRFGGTYHRHLQCYIPEDGTLRVCMLIRINCCTEFNISWACEMCKSKIFLKPKLDFFLT